MIGRMLVAGLALLLAGCGDEGPLDLSADDTWLTPEQLRNGRNLYFSHPTGMFIRTEKGCVEGRMKDARGYWDMDRFDPEAADLYSAFDGSRGDGDNPPKGGTVIGQLTDIPDNMGPGIRRTYPLSFLSWTCAIEKGYRKSYPDPRRPEDIRIDIHTPAYRPDFDPAWFEDLEVKTFSLERGGKTYCKIRLGTQGIFVEKAHIAVLETRNPIPRYEDAEAMDCMVRGLFAAFGYIGILRHDFDRLYQAEDLPEPGEDKSDYLGKLAKGFETRQLRLQGFFE